MHLALKKQYYKYRYKFNQTNVATNPVQVILVFDCDPLIGIPQIFYYKDDSNYPAPSKNAFFDNNMQSIKEWLKFIRDADPAAGSIEFLENLTEEELHGELFIDSI